MCIFDIVPFLQHIFQDLILKQVLKECIRKSSKTAPFKPIIRIHAFIRAAGVGSIHQIANEVFEQLSHGQPMCSCFLGNLPYIFLGKFDFQLPELDVFALLVSAYHMQVHHFPSVLTKKADTCPPVQLLLRCACKARA